MLSTVCGGVLNTNTGRIASPGHNNEEYYPHGVNCTWYITVDPGHIIRLNFQTFSLERAHRSGECQFDFLDVYDNYTMYEPSRIGRYVK